MQEHNILLRSVLWNNKFTLQISLNVPRDIMACRQTSKTCQDGKKETCADGLEEDNHSFGQVYIKNKKASATNPDSHPSLYDPNLLPNDRLNNYKGEKRYYL